MLVSDFTIDNHMSIIKAIEKMNKNSRGIIFVVEEEMLCGVITDGDVRRYVLKKGDLEKNVVEIYNRNAKYLVQGNEEMAYELMKKNGICAIPIVDEYKKIIKICL